MKFPSSVYMIVIPQVERSVGSIERMFPNRDHDATSKKYRSRVVRMHVQIGILCKDPNGHRTWEQGPAFSSFTVIKGKDGVTLPSTESPQKRKPNLQRGLCKWNRIYLNLRRDSSSPGAPRRSALMIGFEFRVHVTGGKNHCINPHVCCGYFGDNMETL